MDLTGPIPVAEQEAASLLMARLAMFVAGVIAMAFFPLVLFLMLIRDRVGNCNWATSDISGSGSWDFVPPQLTCTWQADQLDDINAWSAANDSVGAVLDAGALTVSEQIPATVVSWIAVGMFVFGLILVRLAAVLQHRPAAAKPAATSS